MGAGERAASHLFCLHPDGTRRRACALRNVRGIAMTMRRYSIMMTANPIVIMYCVMHDSKLVEQFDTRAEAVRFIE